MNSEIELKYKLLIANLEDKLEANPNDEELRTLIEEMKERIRVNNNKKDQQ